MQRPPTVRAWDAIERGLLGLLAAAMVALGMVQIVFRSLFHTGLAWIEPLLGVLLLWTTLAGALAATGQVRHISVDLLSHLLPPRAREVLRVPLDLFAALVCAGLAHAGGKFVALQRATETSRLLGLPTWAYSVAIPVAFGLMALRFALHAVDSARRARRGGTPPR